MSKFIMQTRVSDTLNGTMAAGASSCTLLNGNFGAPTGKQIITIDGDVAAKAADFLCTINNTAITAMVKLNGPDVEHTTGASVWMGAVDEHFNQVFNALATGWLDPNETLTCGADNVLTGSAALVSELELGEKIWVKDDGIDWYGYVISKPTGTTFGVVGGSSLGAAVTLASGSTITAPYHSKASSPVGFPEWFSWTPSWTASASMTFASVTTALSKFSIIGRTLSFRLSASGTVGGSVSNELRFTAPVNRADSGSNYPAGYGQLNNAAAETGSLLWSGTSQSIIAITRYASANLSAGTAIINAGGQYEI